MSESINWTAVAAIVAAVLAAAVPTMLLAVLLRRRADRTEPDAADAPPLERAKVAASALTPHEREQFRRWIDEQWPRRGRHPVNPTPTSGLTIPTTFL